MGSPLSPILADIVMQDFEKKVISMLPARLLFYFWYVDDIIFWLLRLKIFMIVWMCLTPYTLDCNLSWKLV